LKLPAEEGKGSNGGKVWCLVHGGKGPVRVAPKHTDANDVPQFHG
jgi:hypothetical protein